MSSDNGNGADIAVDAFGVKTHLRNVKNFSLNTITTVLTMIIVCLIAYVSIVHNADARDSGKEVARALKETQEKTAEVLRESNRETNSVLKELVRSSKEQNCLIATGVQNLPADRRREAADLCKRLSQ